MINESFLHRNPETSEEASNTLEKAIRHAGIPENLVQTVREVIMDIQREDEEGVYDIALREAEMQRILFSLQCGLDSGDCLEDQESIKKWIRGALNGVIRKRASERPPAM